MAKKNYSKFQLKKYWKKIAVIFGVVVSGVFAVGLLATINVLQKFEYAITEAQALTVNMNVQPATTTLESGASRTFTLNLNSNGRQVSFARGVVLFDAGKLELASEVDVSVSPLTQVIEKTSRANANTTGRAAVVLALAPDSRGNPPTGAVLMANLSFRAKSTTAKNVATQITIDSGDIQVVDLQENNLNVSVTPANLTINPDSSAPNPTPNQTPPGQTIRPSARPSIRPSTPPGGGGSQPTQRPTIRPSIRPSVPPSNPGTGGGSIPGLPGGVNTSNLRQYCPLYKVYRSYAFRIYGSRYAQAFTYMDNLCGVTR